MKTIIIGFSRSTKPFAVGSWLVQLYQKTSYSHVYVKLLCSPPFPSNKILHAAEGQVSHYSETAFLTRNKIIKEFAVNITEQDYKYLKINLFHEKAGEPYSILQNIGLVIARFFKIRNPWNSGWNCSEYVLQVLLKTHPKLVNSLNPDKVTPKDIYKILEKITK